LTYEGLGKHEQSLAAFRKTIELNPAYAVAHYNLGTLLLKLGNYAEAVQPLQEAIRLDPQFSDALYNLAAAYAQLGDKGNALQWLKAAIHSNPVLASEAQRDDDLKSLHADPDFLTITQP
jgi:tetratricopeptide (TPR) repeat protein